ncbi:hypothetical protein Cantr_01321 [Candida viswanathii]|uniref:Uncharacterized protein n=1 Tax=Candida viswanathii TaxID=5486 RepID=A0A367YHW5_9ASCO|nr:hypothetical protein Cantr_01321 [Candida viswanathii]
MSNEVNLSVIPRVVDVVAAAASGVVELDELNLLDATGNAEERSTNPLINVQLQLLLHYEPLSKKIFKTICDYSKHVRYELVETYIYNLLQSNNLKAATLLLHKLLMKTTISKYPTSFEMRLPRSYDVFHELIDNVKFYDEITYLVQTNNLLPFLQLAIIFKNNNDPVRIEGIIGYFRRFYSYHQSQYIYKSLLAARVECYASMDDLSQSLSSFVQYAHAHNESDKGRIGKAVPAVLKTSASETKHLGQRAGNHALRVQTNLDVHQNLLAEICNTELFNPIMHRNVYSSTMQYGRDSGMSTIHPVINGSISRNDLPNFEKLITKHIAKMDIREMLQLTVSRHALLHIFVVSGLCNLGKCKTALMYLRTLGPALEQGGRSI